MSTSYKAQVCFGGSHGCEIEFIPTGVHQLRCTVCAVAARRAYQRAYERSHPPQRRPMSPEQRERHLARARERDRLKRLARPTLQRERHLRKKYGLTIAAFEAICDADGRVCTFCGKPPIPGQVLRVEHDHNCPNGCGPRNSCGECIRGLVHEQCNRIIAMFDRWSHLAEAYFGDAPSRMKRNSELRVEHFNTRV